MKLECSYCGSEFEANTDMFVMVETNNEWEIYNRYATLTEQEKKEVEKGEEFFCKNCFEFEYVEHLSLCGGNGYAQEDGPIEWL